MKSILFSLLWVIIGGLHAYFIALTVVAFNLFSWDPNLDTQKIVFTLSAAVSSLIITFLAKWIKEIPPVIVSLIVSILLFVLGIYSFIDFQLEEVGTGFFARRVLSPLWFHLFISFLFIYPIISWRIYSYKIFQEWRESRKINQ